MSYRFQAEEFPKKSCGDCNEASTYDEDRLCWCDRLKRNVDEMQGMCENFIPFKYD